MILSGNHYLNKLHKELNLDRFPIGYCLSLVNLNEPAWPKSKISNALKLFACPSILYERISEEDLDLIEDPSEKLLLTELDFIKDGVSFQDFQNFSINKTMEGYAAWAGVAFRILNERKGISIDEIIDYEVNIQSYWWMFNHLKDKLISEDDESVIHWIKVSRINKSIHKYLSIGPTENTAHRLFKESIIKSSRIKNKYSELKEFL